MVRRRSIRPASWLICALVLAPLLLAFQPTPGAAATLPPAFADDFVASAAAPTALAFTPDGRMLVTQQSGQLFVFRGTTPLGTALDLTMGARICSDLERGLLGVAVDPAFATNRAIYLFYTFNRHNACPTSQPTNPNNPVNRISRFLLPDSNRIDSASEAVLIDNIPSPAGNHNGGDLDFGRDGYLYITTGDGGCDYANNSGCGGGNDAARDPHALLGKILRVTRDGGIPPGNPPGTTRCNATGVATPGQVCQEIFATGLRNPFRFGFDPNASGTRFFINDVGQSAWEEIDEGRAGSDYGWNAREGFCANGSTTNCGAPPSNLTNPLHAYGRNNGCTSITGGAFVPNGVWPAQYNGTYLFSDYVCGTLFLLRQGSGGAWSATEFAPAQGQGTVHLRFGPYNDTQALYYTTYANGGQIRRIALRFSDVPTTHPAYQSIEELRARGLVRGYTAETCAARNLAVPCFGPDDTSLRAQMAVLIVRAMGWGGETATNPFPDRSGIDDEQWNAIGVLHGRGVAKGYANGKFGPNDLVTQVQIASFVTRAMVSRGYWQQATVDDPAIYPNIPADSDHRLDLVTYVQNAGALPDTTATGAWPSAEAPATRGWFARTIWQALDSATP